MIMKWSKQSKNESDTEQVFSFQKEAEKERESNDRLQDLLGEMREKLDKTHLDKRFEEVNKKHDLEGFLTSYYNLGLATAFGNILYALDNEYTSKAIRLMIIDMINADKQLLADSYAIANDMHKNFTKYREKRK